MNTHLKRLTLAMAGAAIITLVGCGGSPGGGTAAVTPEVTTADVATRVIDGAISNALVCMDKNRNGECDASEPQGRTDASGNLTLKVDKADVGKFPLLTLVGIDAVDADHGPVTEPFAMTTPPGKSSVISPLTTMVAQAMESSATEAELMDVIDRPYLARLIAPAARSNGATHGRGGTGNHHRTIRRVPRSQG